MKTKIETITPELADLWLTKHNNINRNVSQQTVESYATDMKNGRWSITHQGIAFDTDGNLQDGQHRLWAVVFSGATVQMNVTRDVPVEEIIGGVNIKTMDAIDRNRVRTTGQQFGLSHGIKNGNNVAAGLRGIANMIAGSGFTRKLSTASALYLYEQYGKDVEAGLAVMQDKPLRISYVLAPIAMYHHGEPDRALELCQQLQSMENMSPAARLIRRMPQLKGSMRLDRGLRTISRLVLAYHNNEALKKVYDETMGIEFLVKMFPSLNKKIKESLTPCRNMPIKKTRNA